MNYVLGIDLGTSAVKIALVNQHGQVIDEVSIMIPIHSSLIPLFSMFLNVNLIDNPWSIVITYTAYNLPITIMILLGFYYTIQ